LLDELAADYAADGRAFPAITYAASGTLAKQYEQGAGYDVVILADERLARKHLGAKGVAIYKSPLALWTPTKATIRDLAQSEYKKIAIADPDVAPFGKLAIEALRNAGVFQAVRSKLVFGGDAEQAVSFVRSKNVDAALIPAVLTSGLEGYVQVFGPDIVPPIPYIAGSASARGTEFIQFLQFRDSQKIAKDMGYLPVDG